MLYSSWHMARDRCNCYFSFWAIFRPFTLITARKMKIKKKKKIPGDIIILHKCTKNHDHMLYCSWDVARDTCNCYFSFWAIFTLLTAQKIKYSKNEKSSWRYHHFTHVYQKLWLDDSRFLIYGARRTGGQTEGRKKWYIEVGAAPKKNGATEEFNMKHPSKPAKIKQVNNHENIEECKQVTVYE